MKPLLTAVLLLLFAVWAPSPLDDLTGKQFEKAAAELTKLTNEDDTHPIWYLDHVANDKFCAHIVWEDYADVKVLPCSSTRTGAVRKAIQFERETK